MSVRSHQRYSKVNWNAHVVISAVAKGHLSLGFVRRNILTTSEQVKSTVYKQLVRPVLEYASATWDLRPILPLVVWKRCREELLDWYAVLATDRATSTTSLLQRLNLQPLSERRGQRRLAVFSQYHHTNTATLFKYVRPAKHASSRRHPDQYFIPQSNTRHHQGSFFFIWTAREWNGIPADSWFLRPPNI